MYKDFYEIRVEALKNGVCVHTQPGHVDLKETESIDEYLEFRAAHTLALVPQLTAIALYCPETGAAYMTDRKEQDIYNPHGNISYDWCNYCDNPTAEIYFAADSNGLIREYVCLKAGHKEGIYCSKDYVYHD